MPSNDEIRQIVEASNAEVATGCFGAGDYRRYAQSQGFKYVELYDTTSSAGDWSFLVSRDGGEWYMMTQHNNYPRPGFSYSIGKEPYLGDAKEAIAEAEEEQAFWEVSSHASAIYSLGYSVLFWRRREVRFEAQRIASVSTRHIRLDDMSHLLRFTGDVPPVPDDPQIVCASIPNGGVLVNIPGSRFEEGQGLSEEAIALFHHAEGQDFDWVHLDRDAPTIENLPVFDW